MTDPRTSGATVAAAKKRPIWPWLLLAALIAALALWWLIAEFTGDDDDLDVGADTGAVVEETTTETETEVTGTETETPAATPDIGLGTVLIGDLDALAPDVDLSASVGEPVEANTVEVQAVVADEAFFVGPEAGQTIMVRLQPFGGAGDEESPFEVQEGDTVSFSGTLEEIDEEFLSSLQLYTPADELETGDYYVQASEITLAE
ncbi:MULTISPECIES: hypothetical protein [unclassified Modestobacter]|uniref:hypothetical protein n=1 Tax=unclassified Modestobacter TaxID=2643866 RepID=UPI0022AB2E9A|nr:MULTISPECIES: hypothetical protein [unclassified Modestobacter]MCZ2822835.1 hypothetical protein [Modestobacter sp. VKM Ac-2981]MCZ2851081.1 hypothetical protein [Modestobacter sp. VKM Ac-2982]